MRHPRRGSKLGSGALRGRHYTGLLDPDRVDVAINGVWVCRSGGVGEERSLVNLAGRDVVITIDLAAGEAAATLWTNDLTADYVHENSAYAT